MAEEIRPIVAKTFFDCLSGIMRDLLGEMVEQLRMIDDRLRPYDHRIG